MKKVIAIGEALIDFIPSRAGCALSEVESFSRACGGAPANVAAAVSLLGGRSALLTKLGADGFGDFIQDALISAGVDGSKILRTNAAHTSLAFVSLRSDGDRDFSFYRDPGADMLLSPDEIDRDFFSDCGILHFCSVNLVDCPAKSAHLRAIEYAKDAGATISFDPNIRLPLWKDPADCQRTVREFLPFADLIKISDDECEFVTGQRDPDRAAERLLMGGAKAVLLSMGGAGAAIYTASGECVRVPCAPGPVVDTTGAGDCLIGAFLYRLIREDVAADLSTLPKDRLISDLTFAVRCAAVCVSGHGAIPSYPTRETLNLLSLEERSQ